MGTDLLRTPDRTLRVTAVVDLVVTDLISAAVRSDLAVQMTEAVPVIAVNMAACVVEFVAVSVN